MVWLFLLVMLLRMKVKFIEDEMYLISNKDNLDRLGTVRRTNKHPHRWQAFDVDGNKILSANQYRNDLFDELNIHFKYKD